MSSRGQAKLAVERAARLTKPGSAAEAARLKVKMFSPDQVYFDGQAVSLSATNTTGPFDILPGHVNFLCLLAPGEIKLDVGFQELAFPITQGVLKVSNDTVTVFLGV